MHRLLPLVLLIACTDVTAPGGANHETEVITTVELRFSPASGDDLVFRWADPEGDGDPSIDPIGLVAGETYSLEIAFLDELVDPGEDLTAEIADEGEEHQVFLTGSAVSGPASASEDPLVTVAYADTDDAGLPLGLNHTASAEVVGSGELTVTLRHMPEEGGVAVKTEDAAAVVAEGGLAAIGGDSDVQVTFPLEVR